MCVPAVSASQYMPTLLSVWTAQPGMTAASTAPAHKLSSHSSIFQCQCQCSHHCYSSLSPHSPPPPAPLQVALNIMWTHLEQRSFKMTEEQYMEKLDAVATMVNVLGQTDKVRSFLSAPAKSQNGMPRRPVVGTAISIQFEMDKATIEEWFGNGYQ